MDLLVIRADGGPAAGAVVGIAAAPPGAVVDDLGRVADARGRVRLDGVVAGHWRFSVWHGGRAVTVTLRLDAARAEVILPLPS